MRLFFTLIISFCCLSGISQNSKKDSVEYYINKGFKYYASSKDSVYTYLGKAKRLGQEYDDIANLCTIYNVESWFASTYGDFEKMKSNIDSLQFFLKKNEVLYNALPDNTFYECQTAYTKGMYNYVLKDYDKARPHFRNIIATAQKAPDSILKGDFFDILMESNIYLNLMLVHEGKFSLAEGFIDSNLRLIRAKGASISSEYNTLIQLANIYRQQENFTKSNLTIQKCLPYYLTKIKNVLDENNPFNYRYHDVSAIIEEKDGNYDNALSSLHKSLSFLKKKWNNEPHSEVATAYHNIALLLYRQHKMKDALLFYDKALSQLSQRDDASTIKYTLELEILKDKSIAYNKLKDFRSASKTTKNAINTLNLLKPTFRTQQDKLFLVENAYALFENGLEATYQLYQETQHDSLIDQAFYLSEKSKSTLLLESLLSTKASEFANIPEELLEKEKLLKTKIIKIENKLAKEITTSSQDKLFTTNEEYRKLQETFEIEYPRYYELKYGTQVTTLGETQDILSKNDVLISYFYGNEAIYGIGVSKTGKKFFKIEGNDQFLITIQESIALFKTPHSNLKDLQQKTKRVYDVFLTPFEITPGQNLIVITDGLLNYIPFGALSTNNAGRYMIQDYQISYLQSATLLKQLKAKKENNKQFLGYAPEFTKNNNNGLLPLATNEREIKGALQVFSGKSLTKSEASLADFYANSPSYSIIHLATHAIYDDKNPDQSYLAFSENNTEETLLFANDLYNLNLNADLVTLSACESGTGELQRGEGLMSIARGFYYAGASSIASTLWSINDAPSATIMNTFYEKLGKGTTKSQALQKAKVEFLTTHKDNALSHPYHWAGIVISGNMEPLASQTNWVWYFISALGLLIILFYIFKNKAKG